MKLPPVVRFTRRAESDGRGTVVPFAAVILNSGETGRVAVETRQTRGAVVCRGEARLVAEGTRRARMLVTTLRTIWTEVSRDAWNRRRDSHRAVAGLGADITSGLARSILIATSSTGNRAHRGWRAEMPNRARDSRQLIAAWTVEAGGARLC
eukprot:scaffold1110_cov254-Pinguiococcus_pyrenoidosus.AAC.10